ncbi:MAGE family-domain-containing protein [Mycena floridula]|nr:MAGE family-domain-containing protein [Mycena floridula]
MPRAATRSQRPPKASQPRQSQRGSRSQPDPEPEDMEEDDDDDDEDEDDANKMDVDEEGSDDISRKANQLVRLALFTEQKRMPLRREEITKKIMGSNTRAFNRVFEAAQGKLRKIFGMELLELRSRAELAKDATGPGNAEEEQPKKSKKKAAVSGSKTYILRSVLDPALIERACTAYPALIAEEPEVDSDFDEDSCVRTNGSIISWSTSDQLGPLGIVYVILSLILVSGRVIGDAELRTHLKRLRLSPTAKVAFTPLSPHREITMDAYLTNLVKQGYLDRQQIGETKKPKGGAKRVRAEADDESGIQYEWRWGNRAEGEISEKALAEFVAELMVGNAREEDDEEVARRPRGQQRGGARKEKMLGGIAKAAGGSLADRRP